MNYEKIERYKYDNKSNPIIEPEITEKIRKTKVMKVKKFIKLIADEAITGNVNILYRNQYYTFYIEDFKFINISNGTGLVIVNILNDEIEILELD